MTGQHRNTKSAAMRQLLHLALALTIAAPLAAQTLDASACLARQAATRPDSAITTIITTVDGDVARGKVDEALIAITTAISSHSADSRLQDTLGRVHYRRGELLPAISALNESMKLDPCNGRAHYDAWRVEAIAGYYKAAQLQLELAHLLTPASKLIQRMWDTSQLPPLTDPPHFNFYGRNLDCDGIPVRANVVVDPAALTATCDRIRTMLAHLPTVRANMIAYGSEIHLYGEDQHISDLPEYRDERGERKFTNPSAGGPDPLTPDKVDIDLFADGLGDIYSACPSVNVLHQHDYREAHKEVCIHEIAHNIMAQGFDSGTRDQIEHQFKSSTSKGLWKGAYAATNPKEFFAELSSWYFGGQGNVEGMPKPIPAPGPDALKAYDPQAFALIDHLYGGKKEARVTKFHDARLVSAISNARNFNQDPAQLLMVNNTGGRLHVYFVRPDGNLTDYGILEPYSRRTQSCYTGEFWLLESPRTKARTLFKVEDDASRIIVDDPAP